MTPERGSRGRAGLYRFCSVLGTAVLLGSVAQGQERVIAGGDAVAVETARHGWLTGRFVDLRGDTVLLERPDRLGVAAIPFDSISAWRAPERRGLWRSLKTGVVGGVIGAMAGAGIGFEGATKVSAPAEVQRDSRRYGLGGLALGLAWSARTSWRPVTVALVRGQPGEEMLLLGRGEQETRAVAAIASGERAITRSEIESVAGATALDAIRRLRPQYLRARRAEVGSAALVLPDVYVDGVRFGELRALESIQLTAVLEIRYLTPVEATMRWGVGHEGGVILVTLRRA